MGNELPAGQLFRATVVVTLLNHAAFVSAQLASLFAQWRPEFELLLIDDGSIDDGFATAQACLDAHPAISAKLLRNAKTTGADVVRAVLDHASSPIVIEADGDDVSLPGRLERIMRCFDEDPSCRLVTSNAVMLAPEGQPIGLWDTHWADAIDTDVLAAADSVGHARWLGATCAFDRAVFDAFPPLDAAIFPPMFDLLLPFRAMLIGSHHYLATPLVGWRQHRANSHRRFGALERGTLRAENFGYMNLLVLAQKQRDLRYRQELEGGTRDWDAMSARCGNLFAEHFERWSRDRAALQRTRITSDDQPYVCAMPVMPTWSRGESIRFDAAGSGASVLLSWSGFHAPESWGTWTQRVAIIGLRLDPLVTRLRLSIAGNPYVMQQKIMIGWYGGSWTTYQPLDGILEIDLVVPARKDARMAAWLLFASPNAVSPCEITDSNADPRLIGLGLISIEAM